MEEPEGMTGTVKSILDYQSVVRMIVILDPGQARPISIIVWDKRQFVNAFEGGLNIGSRVRITETGDGQVVTIE